MDYGIKTNNNNIVNYKSFVFYGKISSDSLYLSPKIKQLEVRSTGYFNETTRLYEYTFSAGEYMIFSRDITYNKPANTILYEQHMSTVLPSNDGNYNTNVLSINSAGQGHVYGMFTGNNPNTNTDFYVYKLASKADEKEYGISIYDEKGDVLYTSAGEPLYIHSTNIGVWSPEFPMPDLPVLDIYVAKAPKGVEPAVLVSSPYWIFINEELGLPYDPFISKYTATAYQNEIFHLMCTFIDGFSIYDFYGYISGEAYSDKLFYTFIDVKVLKNKEYLLV